MALRLADRLAAGRRQRFTGRAAERRLFLDALAAPDPPFVLLSIWGPGGVGKTSLLHELYVECQSAGAPAILVDARTIDPSPQGFLAALRLSAPDQTAGDPWAAFVNRPGRHVLLIDTYELLAPLDGWLRNDFFPQLSDTIVVLASRDPLAPAWRADAGWQDVIHVLALRNLSPDESRAYLANRGVPEDKHQAVLDFTHGHPLALSLVADAFAQRPTMDFRPESAPDIIKTLVEQFAQKVPSPAHRAAIEACALVRYTTETLLAVMLQLPDAHDLFEWLRGLSFVQSGPLGLFPHDLAREALSTDVRWRNPDWFAELHKRARAYYFTHVQQSSGATQQRLLFDYIFLHRHSPVVRPYLEWQEGSSVFTEAAGADDRPKLVAMVRQHEGEESADLALFWQNRQPHSVLVLRAGNGEAAGFVHMLALHEAADTERAHDPAAAAAWRYLQTHAPLRAGEKATMFRFWMAGETYQQVSPVQSLIFVNVVLHYLTTPGLAFTFFVCAQPDFWLPMFSYADLERLPEADFTVGERRYGVFGHDWRAVPPIAWLDALAFKETGTVPSATATATAEPVIVLSEPDFHAAIRSALRSFASPQGLSNNPLLRSRLVLERTGGQASRQERIAALLSILKETAQSLQQTPRNVRLYRALDANYFHPASTQEQAAEILDIPFSTYRRHVQTGVNRLCALLWQRELNSGK